MAESTARGNVSPVELGPLHSVGGSPGSRSIGQSPIPSPQPSFSSSHKSMRSSGRSSTRRKRRNHSPGHTSSGSEDTIKVCVLPCGGQGTVYMRCGCGRVWRAWGRVQRVGGRVRCGCEGMLHVIDMCTPYVRLTVSMFPPAVSVLQHVFPSLQRVHHWPPQLQTTPH